MTWARGRFYERGTIPRLCLPVSARVFFTVTHSRFILGLLLSGLVGLVHALVLLTVYNALGPPSTLWQGDEARARKAFARTVILAGAIGMIAFALYYRLHPR